MNDSIYLRGSVTKILSLRTADVFPVVASLPPYFSESFSEGEKRRPGNASAVRRLQDSVQVENLARVFISVEIAKLTAYTRKVN